MYLGVNLLRFHSESYTHGYNVAWGNMFACYTGRDQMFYDIYGQLVITGVVYIQPSLRKVKCLESSVTPLFILLKVNG